jgi:Family of unknown function (DUF6353)
VLYLLDKNSTGILTGIGVTGTISTAILTGKASFKSAEMIQKEHLDRLGENVERLSKDEPIGDVEDLTFKAKLELVWPQFIPAVGTGAVTVLSIIMANRLASKEIAALAAAYTLSDRAFQDYKEKVVEKLGESKERTYRDELAQERVDKHPIGTSEIIIAGTGEVLCFDILTGRYFQSSVEKIRSAENKVNFEIVNNMYASLSSFYDEIGLPPTGMSDILGFNLDNRLEIKFSTVLSSDQRPCVAIDFHFPPVPDYGKHVY